MYKRLDCMASAQKWDAREGEGKKSTEGKRNGGGGGGPFYSLPNLLSLSPPLLMPATLVTANLKINP